MDAHVRVEPHSFEAKIRFIESNLAVLGAAAEKELVDLAEKYL